MRNGELIIAIALLLVGCYKDGEKTAQIIYKAPDKIHGIDLEIYNANLYLIVHSHPVPEGATALFQIDGTLYDVALLSQEDGKRMLVADGEIIDLLLHSKKAAIEVDGYICQIDGKAFASKYNKVTKS